MLEEDIAVVEGYNSYFSFSKVRSGYSGMCIIVYIALKYVKFYKILSLKVLVICMSKAIIASQDNSPGWSKFSYHFPDQ